VIEISNSLQLHYFFKNNSHSIDSIVRNECEKELIGIIHDISDNLGISIKLETLPTEEGGFKEVWKFLGDNSAQITLIVSITAIFISRFPVENKELTALQIENLKLDNAIKRKELQKLNLEFLHDDAELDEKKITDTAEVVSKNYKVAWRKSNLYKKLQDYPKVEYFEIQRFKNTLPVGQPRKIPRSDFGKFILRSDELPELMVNNAIIDVISPALKSGKFRWKGFYNGEIITFEMNDYKFKNLVLRGDIHFSKNFSIEVEMSQKRKIDQDGNVKVTGSIVYNVIATIEYGERTEFIKK
jgi:hypothetical protein